MSEKLKVGSAKDKADKGSDAEERDRDTQQIEGVCMMEELSNAVEKSGMHPVAT